MKRVLYTLPLLVLILTLSIIHTGCEKTEDPVTPVDENVDKEATTSKNMVELAKLLTGANSFTYLYLNNVPSSGCPDYFFDSVIVGAVVVDYAYPGCVGIDNVRRMGSYNLGINQFLGGDSVYTTISFPDYRISKYPTIVDTNVIKVNGFMNFSTKKISGTTYTFHAKGEAIYTTNLGNIKSFDLTGLHGTVNYNSATTAADDVYTIYGSAIIVDSEFGRTYNISVNQTTSLQIAGNCLYPLSGIMKVLSGSNTDCDFSPNANACDAIAKLTKGSTSKTVDLSEVNF